MKELINDISKIYTDSKGSDRKVKLSKNFLSVDSKRVGIRIDTGPWIDSIDPAMIAIRPKTLNFPKNFLTVFKIANNSDMQIDYIEPDKIRLFPGDFMYDLAKKLSS